MDHKQLLEKRGSDDADARGEHVYPDERPPDDGDRARERARGSRRVRYAAGVDGTEQVPVEPPAGRGRSGR